MYYVPWMDTMSYVGEKTWHTDSMNQEQSLECML